jgi:hypothetical protein
MRSRNGIDCIEQHGLRDRPLGGSLWEHRLWRTLRVIALPILQWFILIPQSYLLFHSTVV